MQIPVSRSTDTDIEGGITYMQQAVFNGTKKQQIDPVETRSKECDLHHIENVRIYQS